MKKKLTNKRLININKIMKETEKEFEKSINSSAVFNVVDIFEEEKTTLTKKLVKNLNSFKATQTIYKFNSKSKPTLVSLTIAAVRKDKDTAISEVVLCLESLSADNKIKGALAPLFYFITMDGKYAVVSIPMVTLKTYKEEMNRVGINL